MSNGSTVIFFCSAYLCISSISFSLYTYYYLFIRTFFIFYSDIVLFFFWIFLFEPRLAHVFISFISCDCAFCSFSVTYRSFTVYAVRRDRDRILFSFVGDDVDSPLCANSEQTVRSTRLTWHRSIKCVPWICDACFVLKWTVKKNEPGYTLQHVSTHRRHWKLSRWRTLHLCFEHFINKLKIFVRVERFCWGSGSRSGWNFYDDGVLITDLSFNVYYVLVH